MQIGPYTIERELGRGGMGAVYLGRAPGAPERVAIKVIHASLVDDPDLVARFRAEGEALERMAHPNLVQLRARGASPAGLWLAMDYVEGETLAEELKRSGPRSSPAAGELLLSLCAGISHAHARGVLHRDLKPENVLIRRLDGCPLIVDFGLALPTDLSQHLTKTGEILGSPGYLAPEQCGAKGQTSPATDVYGLGAVLYAALTGQAPIQRSTLLGVLDAVLHAPPPHPKTWAPDVDPALAAVCLRCLAKDPEERYPSVAALAQALEEEPEAPRGRRLPAALFVVTAFGLGVGGVLGVDMLSDPPPAPSASSVLVGPTPPAATPTLSRAPTRVADPVALERAVEGALGARDWEAAHRLLEGQETPAALWLRHRALCREVRTQGEASGAWFSRREAACALAAQLGDAALPSERVWLETLGALLEAIRYPFSGESPSGEDEVRMLEVLERGRGSLQTKAQRREWARAKALLEVRQLFLRRGDGPEAAQVGEAALAQWRAAGATPWRAMVSEADFWARRDSPVEANRALDQAEVLAPADRPWARYAIYFVRDALSVPPGVPQTASQLHLQRTLLKAEGVPRLLRVRAAIRLGGALVEEDRAAEALVILRQNVPPERERGLREEHAQVLGRALLLAGKPVAAGEALARCVAPALLTRLLKAMAYLQSGERARGSSRLRALPPPTSEAEIETYAEAWALDGDPLRLEGTLEVIAGASSSILDLRVLETLERVSGAAGGERSPQAREVLLAGIESLRARLLEDPIASVDQHLLSGQWVRALRWLAKAFGPAPRGAQAQLATRLTFRALERGREDVALSDPVWQDAYRRALGVLSPALGDSPVDRGLRVLLDLSGDAVPPAETRRALDALAAAISVEPTWPELREAHLSVLLLRNSDGVAQGEGFGTAVQRAIADWLRAIPGDARAAHAATQFVTETERAARLRALGDSPDPRVALAARLDGFRDLCRMGRLTPDRCAAGLSRLSMARVVLRGQRRDLLSEAASLLLTLPGRGAEVLATLARLEAWCGLEGAADRSRIELSRGRALFELGRFEEAKEAGERSLSSSPRTRLLRARALALVGRAEVALGEDERGRQQLKRAVDLVSVPEIWIEFARSTTGAEQVDCFAQALGYKVPSVVLPTLLREIAEAKHDPARVSRKALRLLEQRGLGFAALKLGLAVYGRRADKDTAMLLCEAFLVAAQRSPTAIKALASAEPKLAEAAPLISPEARELFSATLKLLEACSSATPELASLEAVRTELTELEALAESQPELARDFRLPCLLLTGWRQLASVGPNKFKRECREVARTILEAWSSQPDPDLRVWGWLASIRAQEGRWEDSLEALTRGKAALKAAARFPALEADLELQLALNLGHQGRDAEALAALARSKGEGDPYGSDPSVWVGRIELLLQCGQYREAESALDHADALDLAGEGIYGLALGLLRANLLLEQENFTAARAKLESLRGLAGRTVYRSGFLLLEARLVRAEGHPAQALELVNASIELEREMGLSHLARVELLEELGRREDARRAGEASAKIAALAPRYVSALKAKVAALAGE